MTSNKKKNWELFIEPSFYTFKVVMKKVNHE